MEVVLQICFPAPDTAKWFQDMFDKHGFLPRVGECIRVFESDYNRWTKEQQGMYQTCDTVDDVYICLWHKQIFIGIAED